MSDHKHTSGPWIAEWHDDWPRLRIVERDRPYSLIAVVECLGKTPDESKANGNLLAAAPALRDALTELVKLLEPLEEAGSLDGTGLATLNRYRRILALADGKEET